MQSQSLRTFDEWRAAARRFLAAERCPDDVDLLDGWTGQRSLFAGFDDDGCDDDGCDDDGCDGDGDESPASSVSGQGSASPARVPRRMLDLARRVCCHRAADRFNLLYRLLWRLTREQPRLLDLATDADVYAAERMEKQVRRDAHKMKAFVRFRRCEDEQGNERFVAWHRPDHRVLSLTGPFFARRFPEMHWTILTPDQSACWDKQHLTFGPGASASDSPSDDQLESLWRTYYGSIFNPARIKLDTMVREMPRRHWPTLPETAIIDDLLADAPRRLAAMTRASAATSSAQSAEAYLPAERTLESLRQAAAACQGCELHRHCTQTVFGTGPDTAELMLVGEQPGDREDLEGVPFVGPAGEVLDDALATAGVARREVYVTNTVKHFHHQPRGKRRLHKRPGAVHTEACRPWLEAEIALLRPRLIVCLGSTAAQALLGRDFRLRERRGQLLQDREGRVVIATHHPAALLRTRDEAHREQLRGQLVADLRSAQEFVADRVES